MTISIQERELMHNGIVRPLSRILATKKEYTWSDKPTAAEFGKGQAWFSDINTIGYSDGINWTLQSQGTLLNDDTGYIVPSLITGNAATYSQTLTTLTVTSTNHNIHATNHNGKNVYLAIGTVSTGDAPVGYVSGWFSNFAYVDADTFTCTATNSQSGTGFVNTNTTAITLPLTATLPAGILGPKGVLHSEALTSNNSSAGTKTFRQLIGASTWSQTSATSASGTYVTKSIKNRNSQTSQIAPSATLFTGGSSGNAYLSINTAVDVTMSFSLQNSAASDYVALDSIRLFF